MSLRMRKAGLSPRQQTKNNTFWLPTISPEENNLLSGSDKNKLSIPLLILQNTVLEKNDQIKIRNQLSDEKIDCNSCVNDYENQYECDSTPPSNKYWSACNVL
ncbi:hypothetical protein RhiirA1_473193 [Rhizophagus irregularis]|uniref:Uncharacterized protein n=1 Tax=Rhizophagus irregularis TaxID=588596 RepID=A0A2I1FJ66_9GLOM|nr:hypothetical protein RhiirA1_473193 [Rhizophagus irregularis]PKY34420.1 hypothetical protein RhiirB3_454104 [Rhizophagus irregularis]